MRNRVKVIVVTYNSADCIVACLESVLAASEQLEVHITIVDNASSDDTLAALKGLQSKNKIDVIRNSANLGYAHANNVAIDAMLSEPSGYSAVLILNPDVVLMGPSIEGLLATLQSADDIGAVSPRVIEPNESGDQGVTVKTLWGRRAQTRRSGSKNIVEVDRLHGGCMLVKPVVFERIGGFDESYFLYWEEIDLCLRARKAGYKLIQCVDVIVRHRGDSVAGRCRPHRIYYMWRNQFYFSFKNYGRISGTAFIVRRLFSNIRDLLVFACSGRFDLCVAGISGLVAGLRGERNQSTNKYARPERSYEGRNSIQGI